MLEAGFIFWLYRALFFVPSPEAETEELNKRIEELERSVAIGLADGQFWNFLRNLCITIKEDYAGGSIPVKVKVEVSREETYESVLKQPCLFLFVPQELDFSDCDVKRNQIMDFSSLMSKQNAARGCQILPNSSKYRPQWAKLMEF